MTPTIGYSSSRINSIDSSQGDEFGKWLHSSNFRAVKSAANAQSVDNQGRRSFASVLKQVEQDNHPKSADVELRPVSRGGLLDISGL